MLDFLHERVIRFNGNILGFPDLDEFVLLMVEEKGPYAYLQSVKNEHIGFLVAPPFAFYPDYAIEIEESDKEQLGLESPEDAAVVALITIQNPFQHSTINLLAPLVINVKTNCGKQIVLPPRAVYTTKEPLFRTEQVQKGEQANVNSDT